MPPNSKKISKAAKEKSETKENKVKKPRKQKKESIPKNSLDQYIKKSVPNEKENLPKNKANIVPKSNLTKKDVPKTKEVKSVRKRVKVEQNNKITTWLSPSKVEKGAASNFDICSSKTNKKPQKSTTKTSKRKIIEEIPIDRRKSYNFKRFGIFIPTLDEVIKDKENKDDLVQQLDDYDDSSLAEVNSNYILTPEKQTDKLDCKSLSNQELLEYFKQNIDFLAQIQNGNIFSKRHKEYHDKNKRSNHLRCCKTNIMFSFDQMHFLANLIEEKFKNLESEYYFKVLMPELCMKIFMDVYCMNQQQASNYIDKMRID